MNIRTSTPHEPTGFVLLSELVKAWEDARSRVFYADHGVPGEHFHPTDLWSEVALGTRIAQEATAGRWVGVARLLRAGEVTDWGQVAEALGMTGPDARDGFHAWIAGQRRLFAETGLGLSPAEAADLNALSEAVTW
jgi:hypothetical protein